MANAIDHIWAEEGGIAVQFQRTETGGVRITITRGIGAPSKPDAIVSATLAGWRWDRAVNAMTPPRDNP